MAGLLAGTDKRFEEGCSMKVEQPFFYWFVCKSFFSTLLLYHCNDKHWLLLRRNFCIAMLKVFLFCDKVKLRCFNTFNWQICSELCILLLYRI